MEVQDDIPEGWSIGSTLTMIGLGSIAGAKPAVPAIDPDVAKAMFAKLQVYDSQSMPCANSLQTWERSICSPRNLRFCTCEQTVLLQLRLSTWREGGGSSHQQLSILYFIPTSACPHIHSSGSILTSQPPSPPTLHRRPSTLQKDL